MIRLGGAVLTQQAASSQLMFDWLSIWTKPHSFAGDQGSREKDGQLA